MLVSGGHYNIVVHPSTKRLLRNAFYIKSRVTYKQSAQAYLQIKLNYIKWASDYKEFGKPLNCHYSSLAKDILKYISSEEESGKLIHV